MAGWLGLGWVGCSDGRSGSGSVPAHEMGGGLELVDEYERLFDRWLHACGRTEGVVVKVISVK